MLKTAESPCISTIFVFIKTMSGSLNNLTPAGGPGVGTLVTNTGFVSSIGYVSPFEINKPREWGNFIARVELYFTANNLSLLSEERQRGVFLSLCGDDVFQLTRNLCAPKIFR